MTKIEKLRDLHRFFIRKFKVRKPVILRICKLNDCGSYLYNKGKHYISINKKHNWECSAQNLYHEWSHCLEYNKYGNEHHSDSWGVKFSKTYRAYLEWLEENG